MHDDHILEHPSQLGNQHRVLRPLLTHRASNLQFLPIVVPPNILPLLLPLNAMKYTEALHGVTSPFRSWALHLYSILNMVFQYIILCRFDGSISRPNTKDLRVYYLGHERVSMCRSVVLMHLGRGFEVALRIQGVEVDPLPARMTGAV
jgi:hypothetical protein